MHWITGSNCYSSCILMQSLYCIFVLPFFLSFSFSYPQYRDFTCSKCVNCFSMLSQCSCHWFSDNTFGVKLDLVCHVIYTTHCKYIELTTCTLIFAKICQIGSKILEIHSNFTPCKSNGSKFSCTLVSYPNLIALVPPDITSFVERNERNKVGVRDGGGAKRKWSTENLHVMSLYWKWGLYNTSTAI